MKLQDKINSLEQEILNLKSKLDDLSKNVEEKNTTPTTIIGREKNTAENRPIDIRSGKCNKLSGAVVWNNEEGKTPPYGQEPSIPVVGYNKHTHSRYSGGALIKDGVEIVEYKPTSLSNKHSQQFVELKDSDIVTVTNTNKQSIKKIGKLELVFNPDTETWGSPAYEIDVEKCYFIKRDENGEIELDENGNEKKSFLYNEDSTKSALVWDKNAQCWRLYAVYALGEQEEEE